MISPVVKYATMQKENTKKVSMIGLMVKNLQCLKSKLRRIPKTSPIEIEMIPKSRNCPRISKGVHHWKVTVYRAFTVLNRIMETISLTTPSPKTHEKSFG